MRLQSRIGARIDSDAAEFATGPLRAKRSQFSSCPSCWSNQALAAAERRPSEEYRDERPTLAATAAALVGAVPNQAAAQSGSAAVNTTMSTYLAGANTYTTAVFGGGGISPFLVALNAGVGRVLTVAATGTATFCPGATCGTPGPDGPSIGGTNLNASGKISGIQATSSGFLAGVFLSSALPASAPACNFTNLDFLTVAPLLGQQFFIGDGVTSTNVTQQFFVPDGADFLYFGIADGGSFVGDPGFYDETSAPIPRDTASLPPRNRAPLY